MGSYQGFIARKLLTEIEQAVAAANASSPSPLLNEDGSYLSSPFHSNPEMKAITAITITFIVVTFFLVGFLSAQFHRCYIRSGHVQAALYNHATAQGLDGSILETLPKVIFSSTQSQRKGIKKEEKATAECTICLEEFSEQETLRLIPQCGHAFHLECINTWFSSHTTCPLCRYSLLLHPNTVAMDVINSLSDAVMAGNSVATDITLQVRATENPKNPREEEEEEEGESSGNCLELRRSHSVGPGLVNKGQFLPATSSSPLLSFVVHRSSSCTVLSDMWKTSVPA